MAEDEKPKFDRQVHFQHRWKFGHNPGDPDTHKDSGWIYASVDEGPAPVDGVPFVPQGGPESAIPCDVDPCDEILRVVDAKPPADMPGANLPEGFELPESWMEEQEAILMLGCPVHGFRMEMRESIVRDEIRKKSFGG